MAKFHGKVGFAESVESAPGVWTEEIVERSYYGEVIQNSRSLRDGENTVNPALSLGNSISIVANAYASLHFFAIRYVEWAGVFWTVSSVDVERPRLVLRLGEVYNGPTFAAADTP
jgi:hypothetical protein